MDGRSRLSRQVHRLCLSPGDERHHLRNDTLGAQEGHVSPKLLDSFSKAALTVVRPKEKLEDSKDDTALRCSIGTHLCSLFSAAGRGASLLRGGVRWKQATDVYRCSHRDRKCVV